jgi:hypothetical protein
MPDGARYFDIYNHVGVGQVRLSVCRMSMSMIGLLGGTRTGMIECQDERLAAVVLLFTVSSSNIPGGFRPPAAAIALT